MGNLLYRGYGVDNSDDQSSSSTDSPTESNGSNESIETVETKVTNFKMFLNTYSKEDLVDYIKNLRTKKLIFSFSICSEF